MIKKLYIRNEFNLHEKRTALVPSDIYILILNGFEIWIEESTHRIFSNEEYIKNNVFITNLPWYHDKFKDFLIIGLKELNNLDKLNYHKHVYFSHLFQNQNNSIEILKKFKNSKSIIYDFEYFLDSNNKRIITFGYYAGIVGCALGLIQYFLKISKKELNNLIPWDNINELIKSIKSTEKFSCNQNINIAIIGPNGNTGSGVCYILEYLNFKFNKIYRETDKKDLLNYDIIFNCIKLDINSEEIWFNHDIKNI